jgi:Helix-turn-helix domain
VSRQPRILTVPQVQRELALTRHEVTSLIQSGELPAFQVLGQWRVERAMFESLVDRLYERSAARDHPAGQAGAGN